MEDLEKLKQDIKGKKQEWLELSKSLEKYNKEFIGKYYKHETEGGVYYHEVLEHYDSGRFKGNCISVNYRSTIIIYKGGVWFYTSCQFEITKKEYYSLLENAIDELKLNK